MTNLKSFLLGLKFLINITLYPIWMLGFILEMINDPPRTKKYTVDYSVMIGIICVLLITLFAWSFVTLTLLSKIIS